MEQFKIDFINGCNKDLINEIERLIELHKELSDNGNKSLVSINNVIYTKIKLLIKYDFDFTDSSLEIKENSTDLIDLILQCIKDESYSFFNIVTIHNYGYINKSLNNQKHILDFVNRQMFIHNPIDMTELFKSKEWDYHVYINYI